MISNICIVSLLKNYTKKVAKRVAVALEMFYADVEDLLAFDLIDVATADNIVGKEYIEKKETEKTKALSNYENTVITLDYLSLNKPQNLKIIKNTAVLIFLNFNYKNFKNKIKYEKISLNQKAIEITMYAERTKVLAYYADIIVEGGNDLDCNLKNIIEKIKVYYEK